MPTRGVFGPGLGPPGRGPPPCAAAGRCCCCCPGRGPPGVGRGPPERSLFGRGACSCGAGLAAGPGFTAGPGLTAGALSDRGALSARGAGAGALAAGAAGCCAGAGAGAGAGRGPGRGPGVAPDDGLGPGRADWPGPGRGPPDLALPFAGADLDANDSRRRRATGASTVDDADFTNSPCSLSVASSSLLVTPSSLANSCTRALPATALLTERSSVAARHLWTGGPHDLGLSPMDVHRWYFTVCS